MFKLLIKLINKIFDNQAWDPARIYNHAQGCIQELNRARILSSHMANTSTIKRLYCTS